MDRLYSYGRFGGCLSEKCPDFEAISQIITEKKPLKYNRFGITDITWRPKATFSDFEPPNALFVWNPVETG